MKLSKKLKYTLAAPLFVVASLALQFTQVLPTYAATLTWNGDGDGVSFSDGSNWNTGNAPVNGDTVTFNVAGLADSETLTNDISGLSLTGISFTGAISNYSTYSIDGNPLTVAGAISNTTTGADSAYTSPSLLTNLTLAGNTTVSKVNIGADNSTLNLQGYNLAVTTATQCGLNVSSNLSGTGSLNLSATGVNITGTNTSYAGAINVTAGSSWINPTSFGATSAGTTVSGTGALYVVHSANVSVAEPFTLGGSGSFGAQQSNFGCSGGSAEAVNLTLTGGVTLTSNFSYNGFNNTIINAPYTSNDHTFTVASGTNGSLTTPDGQQSAPEETLQLDGDSTTYVNIGNNQTGILNGTRDGIGVDNNGLLKGTGTANYINISAGGTINPGNSPGTITALSTFSLSGIYEAEVLNNTSYDQLVVGQNYTGGGNAIYLDSTTSKLSLVLYPGWSVKQGDSFKIIDNRSSTAVSNTFNGLAEGAQFTVNGVTFNITYVGGDGNDVVVTALTTGTDPSAPNTGVARFVKANPLLVAGLGIVTAGLLITIALRRRAQQ